MLQRISLKGRRYEECLRKPLHDSGILWYDIFYDNKNIGCISHIHDVRCIDELIDKYINEKKQINDLRSFLSEEINKKQEIKHDNKTKS